MINFAILEYQNAFTEQAGKVRGLAAKTFKLNTELSEAVVASQTKAANQIAISNSEYLKGLLDIENLNNAGSGFADNTKRLIKDGENYVTDLTQSLSAVYDQGVVDFKKYRASLEEIGIELTSALDMKKAPVKKAAKSV